MYKKIFSKRFVLYIILICLSFYTLFIYHNKDKQRPLVFNDSVESLQLYEDKKIHNQSIDPIPIIVFSAKRPAALKNHLNLLVKYRNNKYHQFPIIISIDGYDDDVSKVAEEFILKNPGVFKWHHNNSKILPIKHRNYRRISEHYKYSLDRIFSTYSFESLIITEDDLDISIDFFNYFKKMKKLLFEDKTLMCISAWNDNGLEKLIDKNKTLSFKRTDFFPGLGWMLRKDFWLEIKNDFPEIYWDDFLRSENIRKGRNCIIPEISRTYHNMKLAGKGSSGGMYSDKLSMIKLNDIYVNYDDFDVESLKKENYNSALLNKIFSAKNTTLEDLLNLKDTNLSRIVTRYSSPREFRQLANKFNLMNDLRGSGVPRTAYYGIVSFFHNGTEIFLVPRNFTMSSLDEDPKNIIYHSDWEAKSLYLDFEETYCNKPKYNLPKPCDPSNETFRNAFIKKFKKTRLDLYQSMIVN